MSAANQSWRTHGQRALAPWGLDATQSRGRAIAEPACPMRTPFQRDRDRIVHATAFRRLTYKTQVFLHHEGDHFRTRLTHSLEVAQIARALARLLGLDEDLAEALALAHDLGHPPFGHAGERALDQVMAPWGGFDHNAHSLRIVIRLERRYARFDGLNLTLETLEGLAKHNGPVDDLREGGAELKGVLREAGLADRLMLGQQAPAEAQAAAVADDIAYTNHDIDDALRAGLLTIDDVAGAPLVGTLVAEARSAVAEAAAGSGPGGEEARRLVCEVNRRVITGMIDDVARHARRQLADLAVASVDDVRRAGGPVVDFSPTFRRELEALKAFLFARVYRHERVMRVMRSAETAVRSLFHAYLDQPSAMPDGRGRVLADLDRAARARAIANFLAGMTDRFAIREHARLFDAPLEFG